MNHERELIPRQASAKPQPCRLLSLPDELLIHITRKIEGPTRQRSLYHLSLVNRHLSTIACEELFYSPILRPRKTAKFTSRIIDNPKFLKKVTNLEVRLDWHGIVRVDWTGCRCRDRDIFQWTACEHKLALSVQCCEILETHGIKDPSWRWASGFHVGDTHAYIALILAITFNLRCLTISYCFVEEIIKPRHGFRYKGSPIRPYLVSILKNVSPNLQEFTVLNVDSGRRLWATQPGDCYLDMTYFKSVEHLTLPLCGILEAYPSNPRTKVLLPPNMRTFQLRDCSFEAVYFLETFLTQDRGSYPCLREIEVQFDRTTRSRYNGPSLPDVTREDVEPRMLSVQRQMEAAGLKISWVFIDSEKRIENTPKKDPGVGLYFEHEDEPPLSNFFEF